MQEDFFFTNSCRENFISNINSIVLEDSSTQVFFHESNHRGNTQFHVIFDEV